MVVIQDQEEDTTEGVNQGQDSCLKQEFNKIIRDEFTNQLSFYLV